MPHLETTYPTHILRTFFTQQQPTSVLFVDIKAAFYSVLRDFLPGHNSKLTPNDFTTQLLYDIRSQQHTISHNNNNQHLLQLQHQQLLLPLIQLEELNLLWIHQRPQFNRLLLRKEHLEQNQQQLQQLHRQQLNLRKEHLESKRPKHQLKQLLMPIVKELWV
jgi:hypothetical protein